MTPEEVRDNLKAVGLRLDRADRSKACIEQFCVEMESRRYGLQETADALQWVETGWKRARARLD